MIKVYLKGENNTCVGVINECDSLIYNEDSFVKQESIGDYKASELQIVDSVVSVDTVGIEARELKSKISDLKSQRAIDLENNSVLINGYKVNARPKDYANIQLGIQKEDILWPSVDDYMVTVSVADLQYLLTAGLEQGEKIYDDYKLAVKALQTK